MFLKMIALMFASIIITDHFIIDIIVKCLGSLLGTTSAKLPGPSFDPVIKLIQSIPMVISFIVFTIFRFKNSGATVPVSLGFLGGCSLTLCAGNLAVAWTIYITAEASSTSIITSLIALPVASCFLGVLTALICLYYHTKDQRNQFNTAD